MRTRSFSIAACALATGLASTGIAGPVSAAPTTVEAAPPTTPPVDGSNGPPSGIELVDGLGGGGQPDGLPREIVIEGERFLFDRVVPLSRQQLARIAQEQETIAYARSDTAPFPAVYLSVPNRSEDELARYLPEDVGSAAPCPAEADNYDRIDAGGALYAFAGVEGDLTADGLQAVGDSDGAPIYADLEAAQPLPELFIGSDQGLLRFVIVGADGRPASLAESLAFGGAQFAFDSDVTDAIDPATLTKVGCATAFPVYASTGAAGGSTELFVLAGTRWFRFIGDGAAPSPEPTVAPTTAAPTTTTLAPTSTTTTTLAPTTTTLPATTTTLPPTTTLAPTTTTLPPTSTTTTTTSTTLAPTTTTTLPPTTTTTTLPPTTTTLPPTTTTTSTTVASSTTTTTTVAPVPTTTSTTSTTLAPTSTTAEATTTTTTPATTTTAPATSSTTSTSTTSIAATTTTTSEVIQPPAVVATLPPEAPAPAASNVQPAECTGDPGELDARGLPQHLPTRIQLDGVAYVFAGTGEVDAVGTLTRVRCVGPFEVASSDQAEPDELVYLRTVGSGPGSEQVFRFEAVQTFQIEFEITDQAQVLTADDQTYRLGQMWQPAVYSSTTVILFVEDPADDSPDTVFAVDVSRSPRGEVIGQYRPPADSAQTSDELQALAEATGLNPDLTVNGQDYVLVEVYTPAGTTNNGFMTLFGAAIGATPDLLLGRDQRERELFVFLLDAATTG